MRKLTTPDIFKGARVIKALGLREQAKELAKDADTPEDVWNGGFEIMWTLFDKATETSGEDAIYGFLAGPFEMTVDEIKALPFTDFTAMCKQLAVENNLVSFFKSAVALMK